jgi:hypothetical protein
VLHRSIAASAQADRVAIALYHFNDFMCLLLQQVSCPNGCLLQWEYTAMQSCIENCNSSICGNAYASKNNPVTGQTGMPSCPTAQGPEVSTYMCTFALADVSALVQCCCCDSIVQMRVAHHTASKPVSLLLHRTVLHHCDTDLHHACAACAYTTLHYTTLQCTTPLLLQLFRNCVDIRINGSGGGGTAPAPAPHAPAPPAPVPGPSPGMPPASGNI